MNGWALRVHHFLPESRSNGPGLRTVLWVQGCTLGCPGCFNPRTHPHRGGQLWDWRTAWSTVASAVARTRALTVSGGEPFQQAGPLGDLLTRLRARFDLSVLVFTGYTLEELAAMPDAAAVLAATDVLVAGRYVPSQRLARGLLGSANQTIHLLTGRHRREEFDRLPEAEVLVEPGGGLVSTGIDPLRLVRRRGEDV